MFAGSLSFEEGLSLVNARAKAMQGACELAHGGSGMMTVFLHASNRLGQALIGAKLYCKEKLNIEEPVCSVANYLYPECKVIGGHNAALKFIEDNKREFGIARCKRLPVSGAFHTSLMRPAADKFREVLKTVEFRKPRVCVHSNVTGKEYASPIQVTQLLRKQIYK